MVVGDYNGDGFPDIYVGGGGPDLDTQLEEDYLYINEPTAWPADFQQDPDQPLGKAMYEIGALAGVYGNTYMCHGLSAVRIGARVDVLVGNGGPAIYDDGQANVYYSNTGNADGLPYNLLEVALQPTASPPGAIGSRIEVVRDTPGGAGQVIVREQSGGGRFASHNVGPVAFGLGDGGALFVNVAWESGVRQGRLLWPLPTPETLVLTEPEISVDVDVEYPAGGGVDVHLLVTSPSPVEGQLLFLLLVPAGGGGFQVGDVASLTPTTMITPGNPLVGFAHLGDPPDGLYALAWIDPTTGEVLNAGAVWHEQALEASPAPASADAGASTTSLPGLGRVLPRWSDPYNLVALRHELRTRATAVEVAPARVPLRFERIELGGHGQLELDGGDLLRWSAGELVLEVGGPYLATLAFDHGGDGEPLLTSGRPVSCCDEPPPTPGMLLRFPDAGRFLIDGIRYTRDGRRLRD